MVSGLVMGCLRFIELGVEGLWLRLYSEVSSIGQADKMIPHDQRQELASWLVEWPLQIPLPSAVAQILNKTSTPKP